MLKRYRWWGGGGGGGPCDFSDLVLLVLTLGVWTLDFGLGLDNIISRELYIVLTLH